MLPVGVLFHDNFTSLVRANLPFPSFSYPQQVLAYPDFILPMHLHRTVANLLF